jgi:hypothetical protein
VINISFYFCIQECHAVSTRPIWITIRYRVSVREAVRIRPTSQADGVGLSELAGLGVVVAVATVHLAAGVAHVIHQAAEPVADLGPRVQLMIGGRTLARPLDGGAAGMITFSFKNSYTVGVSHRPDGKRNGRKPSRKAGRPSSVR